MKRHIETRNRAKELRATLTEPEKRLWYRDVMTNLDGVVRAILIELGSDPEAPLSQPSPPEGGEGC